MARLILALDKDLAATIRAGHPWVYDRALRRPSRRLRAGELVEVAVGGESLAVGYADPDCPIVVRILDCDAAATIDGDWVGRQVARAVAMRCSDPGLVGSNAYRLIHGENDYLPGLVLDVYANTGVIVVDGDGAAAWWRPHLAAIVAACRGAGIALGQLWWRQRGHTGKEAAELVIGDDASGLVMIEEHGARFEVDVVRGQKTGLFLDQRDNRRRVAGLAAGAEVLNLFSYTGGFSVHAALGGARRVTSVDISAAVMDAARRNFAHNDLDRAGHRFVAGDALEFVERAWSEGDRFDLVICDPPSFAPNKRSRGRALTAYRRLNGRAMALVAPGGLLVTASCSSHITTADMLGVVAEASRKSGRSARVQEIRGAATDHPVRPGFAEGRYLDVLVVYVS